MGRDSRSIVFQPLLNSSNAPKPEFTSCILPPPCFCFNSCQNLIKVYSVLSTFNSQVLNYFTLVFFLFMFGFKYVLFIVWGQPHNHHTSKRRISSACAVSFPQNSFKKFGMNIRIVNFSGTNCRGHCQVFSLEIYSHAGATGRRSDIDFGDKVFFFLE